MICQWRADLRETHESRYFAITEFNNCFIIRSPSLCLKEYLREAKRSAIFTQKRSQDRWRRKAWFYLRRSTIVFAAKNSWTTLRMSTPLFVGSYLQVGVRPYGRSFLLFTNAAAILATLKQVWLDGGSGNYLFWYIHWWFGLSTGLETVRRFFLGCGLVGRCYIFKFPNQTSEFSVV